MLGVLLSNLAKCNLSMIMIKGIQAAPSFNECLLLAELCPPQKTEFDPKQALFEDF